MNEGLIPIILAAGEGRRFGMPKYRAEIRGRTFLEIITKKLRKCGFNRIICVKQKSYDIRLKGVFNVDNPVPEKGMISSIYYGFRAKPDYPGYLIYPVDYPLVSEAVIEDIKLSFDKESALKIIRPVYGGIAGHPIALPASLLMKLTSPEYEGGMREFIRMSNAEKLDVVVNDENILRNINKQEDILTSNQTPKTG